MSEVDSSFPERASEIEATNDVMVLEEIADPELTLPVWEATGNADVDSALELMQDIDPESIHTHAEILSTVHGRLHNLMSQLDR